MSKIPDTLKLKPAFSLMMEVDHEPEHPLQVTYLARQLFDETKSLHSLGDKERDILTAAGLLHDTGWSIGWTAHHKNSRNIIVRRGLNGWSDREVKMVALIARYHRKKHPSDTHKYFRDLTSDDRDIVRKLSALLRLADGFDRSHCESVMKISCVIGDSEVKAHITARRPIDAELSVLGKKGALFGEVFGVPFVVDSITIP